MPKKTISIRLDEEMLSRLRAVADYESRTPAGQIRVLIRECVERFEWDQASTQRRNLTLERQLEKVKSQAK